MSGKDITPEAKPRRRAAGRPAGPPTDAPASKSTTEKVGSEKAPAKSAVAKKKATATKKAPILGAFFSSIPANYKPCFFFCICVIRLIDSLVSGLMR
jgi:hypothetical protein